MNNTETRHPQECDRFGKLAITGHYYYHDKSSSLEYENRVNIEYKKHGEVDYFNSEDQVIEYFSNKITDKLAGICVYVSSCTKGKPYRKSRKPYRLGYIDTLKVSFFLNETEIAYVVLFRA